jgi:hypothetical protein
MMKSLSLTEYAEFTERVVGIFDLAREATRSKGLVVSNPAIGGIGNKISSSL